ncbi:hypothetical protein NLJ89_g565 [Agrocybe chaxingu]|uniref:DUF6535 domain-containing protein n=1 Tax=Agrocybe chaxingu TaxID=84603 RepID=A0A9W8N1U9_9AGAR|nr:hypothetical protein NLJ89_g565 [Agrocybe chaxingu]
MSGTAPHNETTAIIKDLTCLHCQQNTHDTHFTPMSVKWQYTAPERSIHKPDCGIPGTDDRPLVGKILARFWKNSTLRQLLQEQVARTFYDYIYADGIPNTNKMCIGEVVSFFAPCTGSTTTRSPQAQASEMGMFQVSHIIDRTPRNDAEKAMVPSYKYCVQLWQDMCRYEVEDRGRLVDPIIVVMFRCQEAIAQITGIPMTATSIRDAKNNERSASLVVPALNMSFSQELPQGSFPYINKMIQLDKKNELGMRKSMSAIDKELWATSPHPVEQQDEQQESRGAHTEAPSAKYKCGTPYVHSPPKEDRDYWNDLLEPLQAHDETQCKVWKEEVQNILIFASLFSAVVTAFIIESYKNLKPDPSDTAVILLARIAARLDNPLNNSTLTPALDETPIPFSPSLTLVNVFWILSLVVSLTTVLIGIVASQWLREHQIYPAHFSTEQKLALFNMRTEMLNRWYIPAFFTSLPVLLELALVLFFLGLAEFLRHDHDSSAASPHGSINSNSVQQECPGSVMGNFLVRHTFSLIYSVIVALVKYARALHFPPRFPPSSPTPVRNHTLSLRIEPRDPVFSESPDSDLSASPDSDLHRSYQPRWPWEHDHGELEKELRFGPLFDHIRGIELACSRHRTVLLSAYHCFVDCISTVQPGQPSDDFASRSFGHKYYKAVIEILRPHGKALISELTVPKPRLPFASPRPLICDLLYDEAILLLIERFNIPVPTRTEAELMIRILDYISRNGYYWTPDVKGPPKGLPITQARMYTMLVRSSFRKDAPTDVRDALMEYPYSFFRNIADGKMDWSVHQVFLEEFPSILAEYLRSSLRAELRDPELLHRAATYFKLHLEPARRLGSFTSMQGAEYEGAYFLLGSWAIVKAYMLNHRNHAHRVPRSVLDLAVTTREVCENILATRGEPLTRAILTCIASVWGKTEEFVLDHVTTFHIQLLQQESIRSPLYYIHTDDPPDVGLEVSSSNSTDEISEDSGTDSSSQSQGRSEDLDEHNLAELGSLAK